MHIDYTPLDNCKSPEDTYGEICVRCNKCGRFDVKCFICGKVLKEENDIIEVEFYDVFCIAACVSHRELIEKHSDGKYEDKFMIFMTKKDFMKLLHINQKRLSLY